MWVCVLGVGEGAVLGETEEAQGREQSFPMLRIRLT